MIIWSVRWACYSFFGTCSLSLVIMFVLFFSFFTINATEDTSTNSHHLDKNNLKTVQNVACNTAFLVKKVELA